MEKLCVSFCSRDLSSLMAVFVFRSDEKGGETMSYRWIPDPVLERTPQEAWAFAAGHDVDAIWEDQVKASQIAEAEAEDE